MPDDFVPNLTLFNIQICYCCSPAEVSGEVTRRTTDLSCLLPFAVQVCLESTAYSDHHWHLTADWLTQQLQKLSLKGCSSGHDVMRLGILSEVITSTMEAIFSHPLMGEIQRGNRDMLDGIEGGRMRQYCSAVQCVVVWLCGCVAIKIMHKTYLSSFALILCDVTAAKHNVS